MYGVMRCAAVVACLWMLVGLASRAGQSPVSQAPRPPAPAPLASTAAGVPMLDLNDAVARQYEKAGADRTQTSPAGAQLTALTVLEGLRGLPGNPLAALFGTTFSGAAWSTDINGPHLGAWVDTPAGEDWFFHFQDLDPYGRVVHLQPIKWRDDGWPVMGVDTDGDGKGDPVRTWRKPNTGASSPIEAPPTSDEFNGPRFGLQWQWQANPRGDWMSLSASPGSLRLYARSAPVADSLWMAPNLLLQKCPAPTFVVTTVLDFSRAENGESAASRVRPGLRVARPAQDRRRAAVGAQRREGHERRTP